MATPRTFTIALPPSLARQVDKVAKQEGRTRSELFREAIRQYIAKQERWQELLACGQEEAKKRGLTEADVDRAVEEYRHGRR